MTTIDTLFWLLVLTLAVVIYAIEAGVASRHRSAVLCSMFSILASVIYIMFIGVDGGSFGKMEVPPDKAGGGSGAKAAASTGNTGGGSKAAAAASSRSSGMQRPASEVERSGASADSDASGGGSSSGDGGGTTAILPKGPFSDCDQCPSMIVIPPGQFYMGPPRNPSDPESEDPVFVNIKYSFAVSRFEITREQFAQFVEETKWGATRGCQIGNKVIGRASWISPGIEQAPNHPVVCVSWRDARAYVEWLSKKTNARYRLLSEAEWEYMARAGSMGAYAFESLNQGRANFNRMRDGTIPVGLTTPNGFGVFDVHGNAWEMVDDCWNASLVSNSLTGKSTTLMGDCSQRLIRGGGWNSSAQAARVTTRLGLEPASAVNSVGFRIARTFD